ncbi:hypothetical protein K1T71_002766 [Dendrolimus kikuchii]|uniref:Uncharacterized protein n=1 Tax=Dendrolimus kikuchii TaxID=765133 RepID=A0ACC1DDJ4_9NEOP|nr:hypothetical protein K1T71_002766 [Dendrolimus kikuchii]
MQRPQPLKAESTDCDIPVSLDAALSQPENEELFYTASVHFLRKRLEGKSNSPQSKQDYASATQSCYSLSNQSFNNQCYDNFTKSRSSLRVKESETAVESSLSMHQVLPFPKSNKEGFFTRLKSTVRKCSSYLKIFDFDDIQNTRLKEESESLSPISNFKLPHCERPGKVTLSSSLVKICEERSDECIKTNNIKDSSNTCNDLDNFRCVHSKRFNRKISMTQVNVKPKTIT